MNILIAGDFYLPKRSKDQKINLEKPQVDDDMIKIIQSVDYSIVNYESSIVLGKNEKPIEKCGPNLSSGVESLQLVKDLGFKMITLANNHVMDYGPEGLDNIISFCEKSGLDHVGAGRNLKQASEVICKNIQGKKIAFVNCCEHEFSIAGYDNSGSCPLDPILQYNQIKIARKEADYVIVIVHGGHEFFQYPSHRMVSTYRYFIDIGADVVINHHQHCFSGYEVYYGKPIFYGLGNFYFPRETMVNSVWNTGFVVDLQIDDNGIGFKLHPYSQCNGDHKVTLVKSTESFISEINKINRIIADQSELNKVVDDYYGSLKKSSILSFEPYRGKISRKLYNKGLLPSFALKNKEVLLDHLNCESHRDIIIYNLSFASKK